MNIKAYFSDGSIKSIETTFLSSADGYLTEKFDLKLDAETLENVGLVLDVWANVYETDPLQKSEIWAQAYESDTLKEFANRVERPVLIQENNLLLTAEELEDVVLVLVDGSIVLQRTEEGLINVLLTQLEKIE